ncbi:MAG TPA: zinc ABC transporter substrate-binding protein AztC [Paenirhodobacter sp.]
MKNLLKTTALGVLALLVPGAMAASAEGLKVVASFSIIGDLAKQVGGDRVAVTTLVGPDGDAHVYEPRPADAVALAGADVVLVNGLHLEGFLDRLVEASATKAPIAVLTKGVDPLKAEEEEDHDTAAPKTEAEAKEEGHHHGAFDPHAWQSIPNAEIYVKNIQTAYCEVDAAGCPVYQANAAAYLGKLAALDTEVRAAISAIPESKRTIITSHDAFGYFAQAYGLHFLAPQGVSTEAEASAADVAGLVRQIREDHASALFIENISDPRLIEQIAAETGLKQGGTLYSDALSGPDGPAATYVDMMHNNIAQITAAVGAQ